MILMLRFFETECNFNPFTAEVLVISVLMTINNELKEKLIKRVQELHKHRFSWTLLHQDVINIILLM